MNFWKFVTKGLNVNYARIVYSQGPPPTQVDRVARTTVFQVMIRGGGLSSSCEKGSENMSPPLKGHYASGIGNGWLEELTTLRGTSETKNGIKMRKCLMYNRARSSV